MNRNYFILLSLLLYAGLSQAVNMQGTGAPIVRPSENMEGTGINSLQIIPGDDGRLVLQAQQDGISLIGSSKAGQNYSELILDQLTHDGQLTPNWGKAEVLLGCYQADVLLYQQQNNTWVEIAAVHVATDYCAE